MPTARINLSLARGIIPVLHGFNLGWLGRQDSQRGSTRTRQLTTSLALATDQTMSVDRLRGPLSRLDHDGLTARNSG